MTNPLFLGTPLERSFYYTTLNLGTDQKWIEIDTYGQVHSWGVWSVSNSVLTLRMHNGYSTQLGRTTDGWRSMIVSGSNVVGESWTSTAIRSQ